jgi:diguanylate cyclase (GGDEF)-like protein
VFRNRQTPRLAASDGDAFGHPRTISWLGTTALAMGGSNQSLFLIGALVMSQGSAAIPLLALGLVLSWFALPGWTELVLMWPKRVGGIAATCAEAFRPYSPVLANLTGVCYWWGWIPTCGLTAILSASALHQWYLPGVPVQLLAIVLVLTFTAVNLCGVRWVSRLAVPIALGSALLALLSAVVPVVAGSVDWQAASTFHLTTPFAGAFGGFTSAMAGLYLIGFAAPAFEAAACHVGETIDPEKNVPRAMFAAAGIATLYFVVLPVVWLGVLGPQAIEGELMQTLGPTFAPLFGGFARAAAIWFMVLNMFHGTLQPLAGASRTLSQLSEDGLLPRSLARRTRTDAPWVATLLTAGMSIIFLLSGDPPWIIAAANFAYLIGIGLPSVAVWLLRKNAPEMRRPYRAPRGTIALGLVAAAAWLVATLFGFEQFGLPTVLLSMALAYAGTALYAWRRVTDLRREGNHSGALRSLHVKLTGAMLLVMALDAAGYLLAVTHVHGDTPLRVILEDTFVAVAILTISVGLILPGMIASSVSEVSDAANRLATRTVADLTRAMQALGRGELAAAHARTDIEPVTVRSRDEVGRMAESFNLMQVGIANAAGALDGAREGLRDAQERLEQTVAQQAAIAALGRRALEGGEPADLMRETVGMLRRVLRVQSAAVMEHHDDGSTRVRAVEGSTRDTPTTRGASTTIVIRGATAAFGSLEIEPGPERTLTSEELDFLDAIANVLADAVARRTAEQELRHQALHDPLTGLPNRLLFVDTVTRSLARAARRGHLTAVLFLDVDGFKLVNDSLGHAVGDEVLQELAQRLAASLRPSDAIARFGGDEFVILCKDARDPRTAVLIAEDIVATIARPIVMGGVEHAVSASLGIALAQAPVSGRPRRNAEDMIREADAAMYRAKDRGRGRVELYDEEMRANATSRLRLEAELRHAVENDELRLVYQPIVSLADGFIVGLEALVRWQHPVRGLLAPEEFIAVAEETSAIIPIGRWVIHEACRTAASWRDHSPTTPGPAISVNLSLRQVGNAQLTDDIAEALATSRLAPGSLHLEITESALMEDTASNRATLLRMKALGVTLVLDDFGTGYSSLAHLRRFPIDTLKIDRSFVEGLDGSDTDSAIVAAIINMSRGLRVEVIAEGIETAAQAARLRELGCELGQGYYYARPLPADHITALLGTSLPAPAALAA